MEDKAAEAELLADALTGILDLYRAEFLPASPPRAEPAPVINHAAIRDKHVAAAKRSTNIFDRTGRKAALAEADRLSLEEVKNIQADAERQRQSHQRQLDEWWASLLDCEPEVVLGR